MPDGAFVIAHNRPRSTDGLLSLVIEDGVLARDLPLLS
jgi:hypothetical protein